MPSISQSLDKKLKALADADAKIGIRARFNGHPARAEYFSYKAESFFLDLSKTHISEELIQVYQSYCREIDFSGFRHALFSGKKINLSEQRSVLHTLLRNPENQGITMESDDLLAQGLEAETQFFQQYESIQKRLAQRDVAIKHIIHVGIGGSALGPKLVFEALKSLEADIDIYFVGNIDAHELLAVLSQCDPAATLVVGVSKTFTTAETLKNLDSVADWLRQAGVERPKTNLIAVTANPAKAVEYGITDSNVVAFPTWVGGRYSVWSSVSLSVVLVIGLPAFKELLRGAAKMDEHFYHAELDQNLPFLTAAMDHYYVNYFAAGSRAIFAYDYRLRSLVDYLQQLETESNGKDRQRNGEPVDQLTAPVVWGGVGTDVQHSVFQMLHQGTSLIPSEFILVKNADHHLVDHHQELLANGLAQTAALLAGQDKEMVNKLHAEEKLSEKAILAKQFSGDRPSTTILLDRLTPFCLGQLLALYEHRTFCFGALTSINSYDQMGVELGKRLAKSIEPMLAHGVSENDNEQMQKRVEELDSSTRQLLAKILSQ